MGDTDITSRNEGGAEKESSIKGDGLKENIRSAKTRVGLLDRIIEGKPIMATSSFEDLCDEINELKGEKLVNKAHKLIDQGLVHPDNLKDINKILKDYQLATSPAAKEQLEGLLKENLIQSICKQVFVTGKSKHSRNRGGFVPLPLTFNNSAAVKFKTNVPYDNEVVRVESTKHSISDSNETEKKPHMGDDIERALEQVVSDEEKKHKKEQIEFERIHSVKKEVMTEVFLATGETPDVGAVELKKSDVDPLVRRIREKQATRIKLPDYDNQA